MRVSMDLVCAFAAAFGAHGLLLIATPDGGGGDGGAGGANVLSLAASSPRIAELVERWETPAPAETAAPVLASVAPPQETETALPSGEQTRPVSAAPSPLDETAAPLPPVIAQAPGAVPGPPRDETQSTLTVPAPSETSVKRSPVPTALAALPDEMATPSVAPAPPVPDHAPRVTRRPPAKPTPKTSPAVARKTAAGPGLGTRKGPAQPTTAPTVSPAARQAAQAAWAAQIQTRIARFQRYPRGARGDGRVKVAMVIHANGQLGQVSITQSSGADALDKAALQAVRQAAPFPPAPDALTDTYFTVGQWIRFARR